MFLVPALFAGACDSIIIYLSNHYETKENEHGYVSNVSYLAPLAVLRLILLLIPLPYHTYKGTAVNYPALYRVLHWGTLLAILFHMLSIIMIDPDSLGIFFPAVIDRALKQTDPHVIQMRRVWLMLTLSLISTIQHIILLWHVRSTAQHNSLDSWKRRKRVLYYYAQQQNIANADGDNGDVHGTSLQIRSNRGESNGSLVDLSSHAFQPYNDQDQIISQQPQTRRIFSKDEFFQQVKCISSGGNEFMSELQIRLETARREWGQRLEDVSNRLAANRSTHSREMLPTSPFLQLTPFRVLLQLFAYEEVLANSRLSQVFDEDDGVSLTFYVPQLLSFLLHGAYQSSPQLEEWILTKCRANVHFAHRCYWFLRAWCLEGPGLQKSASVSARDLEWGIRDDGIRRHPLGSNHNSSTSLHSLGVEHAQSQPHLQSYSGFAAKRVPSFGSLPSDSSTLDRPPKLLPEDETLIEGLMFRVMESGEESASNLHNCEGYARDDTETELEVQDHESSNVVMGGVISAGDFVAVDANSGFPTVRHIDSVTAKQRVGFMPLNARRESWNVHSVGSFFETTPSFLDRLTSIAEELYLIPRELRTGELRRQLQSIEAEFLPCNSIYVPIGDVRHRVWRIVADESIAISTKERVPCIICLEVIDYEKETKSTLKKGFLGNALLGKTSNEPTQQKQESVSSAASNGSVSRGIPGGAKLQALLPGHTPDLTEREIIRLWQKSPRHPHRHDSLLDKVTTFTQTRIRKLVENGPEDAALWSDGGSWHDVAKNQYQNDINHSEFASLTGTTDPESRYDGSSSKPPLSPIPRPNNTLQSTPSSSPITKDSTQPSSPNSAMGQWSSPTPHSSPAKQKQTVSLDAALFPISDPPEQSTVEAESTSAHVDAIQGSESVVLAYGAMRGESTDNADDGESVRDSIIISETTRKQRRPPAVVFKESWVSKQERIRKKSALGSHPGWRLLPILIKPNDDLRQEQLASQLIYRMASILAREKVPVWLCPYEIVALTNSSGIIEAIPDTISLDSLKRNDPNFSSLRNFFINHFGEGTDELADATANFVESLAAYSIVCYLLQIKDRHNGNILLTNRGHLIHIDFGFFFLASPGKNVGFESAPFKLSRDFVDVMGSPDSNTFRTFRELCCRTFISLRHHCYEITLLVEMLMVGNEDLPCFRGRPEDAVSGLRERFRLDLNDRACMEYVNELVDGSLFSWRTTWYDRYQRFCVGVL